MSRNFGLKAHEIEDIAWTQNEVDSSHWVFVTLGVIAACIIAAALLL